MRKDTPVLLERLRELVAIAPPMTWKEIADDLEVPRSTLMFWTRTHRIKKTRCQKGINSCKRFKRVMAKMPELIAMLDADPKLSTYVLAKRLELSPMTVKRMRDDLGRPSTNKGGRKKK